MPCTSKSCPGRRACILRRLDSTIRGRYACSSLYTQQHRLSSWTPPCALLCFYSLHETHARSDSYSGPSHDCPEGCGHPLNLAGRLAGAPTGRWRPRWAAQGRCACGARRAAAAGRRGHACRARPGRRPPGHRPRRIGRTPPRGRTPPALRGPPWCAAAQSPHPACPACSLGFHAALGLHGTSKAGPAEARAVPCTLLLCPGCDARPACTVNMKGSMEGSQRGRHADHGDPTSRRERPK